MQSRAFIPASAVGTCPQSVVNVHHPHTSASGLPVGPGTSPDHTSSTPYPHIASSLEKCEAWNEEYFCLSHRAPPSVPSSVWSPSFLSSSPAVVPSTPDRLIPLIDRHSYERRSPSPTNQADFPSSIWNPTDSPLSFSYRPKLPAAIASAFAPASDVPSIWSPSTGSDFTSVSRRVFIARRRQSPSHSFVRRPSGVDTLQSFRKRQPQAKPFVIPVELPKCKCKDKDRQMPGKYCHPHAHPSGRPNRPPQGLADWVHNFAPYLEGPICVHPPSPAPIKPSTPVVSLPFSIPPTPMRPQTGFPLFAPVATPTPASRGVVRRYVSPVSVSVSAVADVCQTPIPQTPEFYDVAVICSPVQSPFENDTHTHSPCDHTPPLIIRLPPANGRRRQVRYPSVFTPTPASRKVVVSAMSSPSPSPVSSRSAAASATSTVVSKPAVIAPSVDIAIVAKLSAPFPRFPRLAAFAVTGVAVVAGALAWNFLL
ncbi:hypothetical protein SUNI508_13108 [Seiridium unicorne]|uniref:Uncharacterized protein n=1 Tax=Seiridium unicorne TaxID=138068 RepID=A0ABR2VEP1_9PEZI